MGDEKPDTRLRISPFDLWLVISAGILIGVGITWAMMRVEGMVVGGIGFN